jgi:hypothetical protein
MRDTFPERQQGRRTHTQHQVLYDVDAESGDDQQVLIWDRLSQFFLTAS